jgi:hypothetical protein
MCWPQFSTDFIHLSNRYCRVYCELWPYAKAHVLFTCTCELVVHLINGHCKVLQNTLYVICNKFCVAILEFFRVLLSACGGVDSFQSAVFASS